jgi:hypothetical protein
MQMFMKKVMKKDKMTQNRLNIKIISIFVQTTNFSRPFKECRQISCRSCGSELKDFNIPSPKPPNACQQ